VPYLVYVLSGLLVVTYFQQGVALTASSIAASANLLTKVHLPPVIFAFAAACSGAVNFVFGLAPLIVFQIVFGVGLRWTMLLIPVPLFFLLLLIAGVGFLLATFVIRFDDVLNLMNVLLMMMSYVTPTFYPVTIVDPAYQHLFYINPLYAYVNVFRYLDYGGPLPALGCLPIIVGTGVLGFTWGLIVFVRRWPSLAVYL
jgi:ABC-type polysaccharide/polyol phosphate export permease